MGSSPELKSAGSLFAGRYQLRKKLGSGSLGTVYLAADERAGRLVALKILRRDRPGASGPSELQKEFEAFAALDHPRVARAYDFGYADANRIPYYTREYIPGVPVTPGPPLDASPRKFLRPILDLLEALEYLHSNGILHLDVHAGNLIVAEDTRRGSVLIDFGILRSIDARVQSSWLRAVGVVPHELREPGAPLAATDIYMAGRLLLHRLTGRVDCDPKLLLEVSGWGDRLNVSLERILSRALEPNPAQRFSTARELREALQLAVGEERAIPKDYGPIDVFIGRDQELRRLDEALRKTLSGESTLYLVKGPAGSGKSRLLKEARRRAQVLGCEVIEARFSQPGGPAPLLLSTLRAAGSKEDDALAWLEPLSVEHGGTSQERAERAAKGFFASIGKPLALFLDDVDSVDPESGILLEALVREGLESRPLGGSRALCLVSTSSVSIPAHLKLQTLKLRPLGWQEARRLFESLLRPLTASHQVIDRCLRSSGRSPLRVRQMASALRDAWARTGRIPASALTPDLERESESGETLPQAVQDAASRGILLALAILDRPASVEEIAELSAISIEACRAKLRMLTASELIFPVRVVRERAFAIAGRALGDRLLARESHATRRRLHDLAAQIIARSLKQDPVQIAELAMHLLDAGKTTAGVKLALNCAPGLRELGYHEHALKVLNKARAVKISLAQRLDIADAMSSIIEETGDHAIAVQVLEPLLSAEAKLPRQRRVRVLRMLGVHYHRAGNREQALQTFASCRSIASRSQEQEDLILVESEVAELHTYQGAYVQAEEACRRGLDLLSKRGETPAFKARMEVILRATLGHVALRKLDLENSRTELRAALRSLPPGHLPAIEAVILNNLGIAERQLGHFREARHRFQAAEHILKRSGEGRSLIKIACNVALIAAQEGKADEAERELTKAAHILHSFPGARLEFFTDYTRGIVAHTLGDETRAMSWLERALKAGRRLGDTHLVAFGEVILAEAQMVCGRYAKSLEILGKTVRGPQANAMPLLKRMAWARLSALYALMGDPKRAASAAAEFHSLQQPDLEIPEAWNHLFLGFGSAVLGFNDPAKSSVEKASKVFRRVGLPAAERLVRLVLLAIGAGGGVGRGAVEMALRRLTALPQASSNRALGVLEPLLAAEARFALGDLDNAEAQIALASAAMVGLPYLELDWRIELTRGRIVLQRGDRANARRHAQRALHLRDLILELVPPKRRERFLNQPRFQALEELARRVERFPKVIRSTEKLARPEAFEGMLGASTAMGRVFQSIDRLRDHEVPVLIQGETGTGKELVARALHRTSSRWNGPFLAVHCAALPEELFEAELFGHEAAAFTGAESAQPGLLEASSGGTVLLDDVEQLSLKSQAKLLHVLSSGRMRRLGGLEERPFDVRFLASTSRDLGEEVRQGAFRPDLYFRLRVADITLPPLRERRRDISLLALHFVERHAQRLQRPVPHLEQGVLELLESQAWPGNVRELESVILRVLLGLSPGGVIRTQDVQGQLLTQSAREPAPALSEELLRSQSYKDWKLTAERAYILWLQKECQGDPTCMMARLGVKRTQFYALLRKVGLHRTLKL